MLVKYHLSKNDESSDYWNIVMASLYKYVFAELKATENQNVSKGTEKILLSIFAEQLTEIFWERNSIEIHEAMELFAREKDFSELISIYLFSEMKLLGLEGGYSQYLVNKMEQFNLDRKDFKNANLDFMSDWLKKSYNEIRELNCSGSDLI